MPPKHDELQLKLNCFVTLLSNMNDTQSSDKWYLNENLCNESSMLKIIRRQQHKNLVIPQTNEVSPKGFENAIYFEKTNFQ
jgi:hypothetical protein